MSAIHRKLQSGIEYPPYSPLPSKKCDAVQRIGKEIWMEYVLAFSCRAVCFWEAITFSLSSLESAKQQEKIRQLTQKLRAATQEAPVLLTIDEEILLCKSTLYRWKYPEKNPAISTLADLRSPNVGDSIESLKMHLSWLVQLKCQLYFGANPQQIKMQPTQLFDPKPTYLVDRGSAAYFSSQEENIQSLLEKIEGEKPVTGEEMMLLSTILECYIWQKTNGQLTSPPQVERVLMVLEKQHLLTREDVKRMDPYVLRGLCKSRYLENEGSESFYFLREYFYGCIVLPSTSQDPNVQRTLRALDRSCPLDVHFPISSPFITLPSEFIAKISTSSQQHLNLLRQKIEDEKPLTPREIKWMLNAIIFYRMADAIHPNPLGEEFRLLTATLEEKGMLDQKTLKSMNQDELFCAISGYISHIEPHFYSDTQVKEDELLSYQKTLAACFTNPSILLISPRESLVFETKDFSTQHPFDPIRYAELCFQLCGINHGERILWNGRIASKSEVLKEVSTFEFELFDGWMQKLQGNVQLATALYRHRFHHHALEEYTLEELKGLALILEDKEMAPFFSGWEMTYSPEMKVLSCIKNKLKRNLNRGLNLKQEDFFDYRPEMKVCQFADRLEKQLGVRPLSEDSLVSINRMSAQTIKELQKSLEQLLRKLTTSDPLKNRLSIQEVFLLLRVLLAKPYWDGSCPHVVNQIYLQLDRMGFKCQDIDFIGRVQVEGYLNCLYLMETKGPSILAGGTSPLLPLTPYFTPLAQLMPQLKDAVSSVNLAKEEWNLLLDETLDLKGKIQRIISDSSLTDRLRIISRFGHYDLLTIDGVLLEGYIGEGEKEKALQQVVDFANKVDILLRHHTSKALEGVFQKWDQPITPEWTKEEIDAYGEIRRIFCHKDYIISLKQYYLDACSSGSRPFQVLLKKIDAIEKADRENHLTSLKEEDRLEFHEWQLCRNISSLGSFLSMEISNEVLNRLLQFEQHVLCHRPDPQALRMTFANCKRCKEWNKKNRTDSTFADWVVQQAASHGHIDYFYYEKSTNPNQSGQFHVCGLGGSGIFNHSSSTGHYNYVLDEFDLDLTPFLGSLSDIQRKEFTTKFRDHLIRLIGTFEKVPKYPTMVQISSYLTTISQGEELNTDRIGFDPTVNYQHLCSQTAVILFCKALTITCREFQVPIPPADQLGLAHERDLKTLTPEALLESFLAKGILKPVINPLHHILRLSMRF